MDQPPTGSDTRMRDRLQRSIVRARSYLGEVRARPLYVSIRPTWASAIVRLLILVAITVGAVAAWGLDSELSIGAILVAMGAALYAESHVIEFSEESDGVVVDSSDVVNCAILLTLAPRELVITLPLLALYTAEVRGQAGWDKIARWFVFALTFSSGAMAGVYLFRAAVDLSPIADVVIAGLIVFVWFRLIEALFVAMDYLVLRREDRGESPFGAATPASFAHVLKFTHTDYCLAVLASLASLVAWWAYALLVAQHRFSWLATTQASRLAIAISESRTDALTGLMNRRAIRDRCLDPAEPLVDGVVLMVDLDRFKRINDEFGHDAGDEAIRIIGDILNEMSTERSLLSARWGGEEFLVVLPHQGVDAGLVVAERIRRRAKASLARWDSSASIGIGYLDQVTDFDAALARADLALYKAKARGRDQVVLWEPAFEAATSLHTDVEPAEERDAA